MSSIKKILLIPVYNDWQSLNRLLENLIKKLKKKQNNIEILIINDNSTQKNKYKTANLKFFKKIKILNLSKNVGSQIAIAIGLLYLNTIKNEKIITVMDSDGEDSPNHVSTMINLAIKNPDCIITSCRLLPRKIKIINLLYKIHQLITFLFAFKWISFGNFTSFHSRNLNKIFLNKHCIYAYPSAILKNCKIKKTFFMKQKRYFGKSKLSFFSLVGHSLRLNVVFINRIIFFSFTYSILIYNFYQSITSFFLIFLIMLFNIFLILTKLKYCKINYSSLKKLYI